MRNTSPVGWRVTRYDYINRQLYSGDNGLGYLNENPPDLWLSADKGLTQVGARGFNGVDQKFTFANLWQFSTDSVSFEFFCNTASSSIQFVIGGGGGSTSVPGMSIYHNDKYIAMDMASTTSVIGLTTTDLQPTVAQWNHMVVAVDRTNHQVHMWLNSTKSTTIHSSTAILNSVTPSGLYTRFGGYQGASTVYINKGVLSRLRIAIGYVYQTSDVEVTYNNGNGLLQAELPALLASKITHSYNLNEAFGNALDCVSSYHGAESGTSTNISSTDGPRESIVADNSGNDYHLKLVNYSASQKVTNWVTDSDGSEGLMFESASSHYCEGSTRHPWSGSTSGFNVGSIGFKFKWNGSTNDGSNALLAFQLYTCAFLFYAATKRFRAYFIPQSTNSTVIQSYTPIGSINNTTEWQTLLCTLNVFSTNPTYPKLYLNGTDVSTLQTASTTWRSPSLEGAYLNIGKAFGTTTITMNVTLDKVQLWNVELQSSDAVAFHNGSTPAVAPVMDYTFNDGPQESGVSDGDSIAGWKSREGKNYQFNQGTLANRPKWIANANKGQPGIDFDGTNDHLFKALKTLTTDVGVFYIVAKPDVITSQRFYTQCIQSTLHSYDLIGISAGGYFIASRKNGLADVAQVLGSTYVATTTFQLFKYSANGTFSRFKINGYEEGLYNLTTGVDNGKFFSHSSGDVSCIGAIFINSTARVWLNGSIEEIIAYEGANTPSTNNMLAIEKYLLTKYGIST